MPGGNSEANKAEAYLAALKAGEELKTDTIEVPVTPAEEARAAAVEAIKKVELPALDTLLEKVGVAPAPKIEVTPVDDGAVIINERIIDTPPAAPQPEMMEQIPPPWQGKDMRTGSGNERKSFPSHRREAERWAGVIDGTAREVPPVEIPTIAQQPQSGPVETPRIEEAPTIPVSETLASVPAPQTAAEVMPAQQVEVPPPAPSEEIMTPPEKFVPLMTEDGGPEQDGEHRAPQYGTSNQETLDGTQKAYNTAEGADIKVSSVQPEDVERSLLEKGEKEEKITVPEPVAPAPVAEKAPAPVVEAPKVATSAPVVETPSKPFLRPSEKYRTPPKLPHAAETPKENPPTAETPKTAEPIPANVSKTKEGKKEEPASVKSVAREVGRGYLRTAEALAGAFAGKEVKFPKLKWEGMGKALELQPLSSGAKRFVRSLYTSQPANAIRAVGWRMSIGFNDRLANYFGEQASMRGSDRERTEALLTRVKTKQQQEADEMKEFGERFKGAGITPDVAKQSEQERIAHENAAKGLKAIAEVRGKEEIKLKGKEGTFVERRNKAAEKLAAYVGERLKPFETKLEAIRTTKEKMDGELEGIQTMRDRLQVERDRVVAEKERMNMASKPKSFQMAWNEVVRSKEEQLAHIDDLMKVRAGRRETLEVRLKEINEQAEKIRPVLKRWEDIPKQIRVSERPRSKVELPPEPEDAAPSVAEEMEKFEIETGVRHEPIPDMTTTEFIEVWNTYAGADIPLNARDLSAFMGVEQNKEINSEELMTKLTDLLTAMTKDKNKKRLRVSQEVVMANLKPFRTYLRLHHS